MKASTKCRRLIEASATREIDARWYHTARAQVAQRAQDVGLPVDTFTGMVAALSPLQAWDKPSGKQPNLDRAERFARDPSAKWLPACTRHARAIQAGADPLDELRSPKCRAFYQCLTDPDHTDAVVVDTWVARALGIRSLTPRRYRLAADAIRAAAAAAGLTPNAAQAVIWAQARRTVTTTA